MPDLQTELSKVINAWEAPEASVAVAKRAPPQHAFKVTTNTSRATFDYIRDNPGVSRAQAVHALTEQGYKRTSTSSLMVQMLRQGMLRESNGALFVAQAEYTPVKARLVKPTKPVKAPATKAKRKYVRRNAAAKAAAYEAHENYNPTALDTPTKEFDAEEFVNALTLKQAKAVFMKLKEVFA
jgi:hypothetical protein